MWYTSARLTRLLRGGEMPGSRPAMVTGLPFAADATNSLSTRTQDARAEFAARESIFERVCRAALRVAASAWSDIDDNAHVDRRAPPGRDPSGRDQGKSN